MRELSRVPRVLVLAVAVVTVSALAPPAAGAGAASDVTLATPSAFRVNETLLFVGALSLDPAVLTDPGLVDARRFDLPPGTLTACPVERGSAGLIPTLRALDGRCRGGVTHVDPTLTIAGRTWLRFAGAVHVVDAPAAAASAFAPAPALSWFAVTADAPVTLRGEGDEVRFGPTTETAEIVVTARDGRTHYNGTAFAFVFEGDGDFTVASAGLFGATARRVDVTLVPGDVERVPRVLDARVLLDLQQAALGAEARESLLNASRLFRDHGRIPDVVNAALLGHVNGTVADRAIDPERVSLVHVERLDARIDARAVTGTANVLLVSAQGGLALADGRVVSAPWVLAGVLWAVAGVSVLVRAPPAGSPSRVARAAAWLLPVAALVAWDIVVREEVGVSASSVLTRGDVPAGLAFLVFQVVALGLAWVLLALPLRIGASRVLPERAVAWARPAAAVALIAFVALRPGAVLALGHLVARL